MACAISAATSPAGSRLAIATSKPAAASACAVARPMPLAPPVTSAAGTLGARGTRDGLLHPAKAHARAAGHRPCTRPVLTADPAFVSAFVEHREEIRIVHLAHVRLVALRRARDLHMTDVAGGQ